MGAALAMRAPFLNLWLSAPNLRSRPVSQASFPSLLKFVWVAVAPA